MPGLTKSQKIALLEEELSKNNLDLPYDKSESLEDRKRFWNNNIKSKDEDESGYIYFVKEKMNGTVKIGKTKNPHTRLRLFEVKLPFEIEILNKVKVKDRHKAEDKLHGHFEDKNKNGEWFELEEDVKESIRNNDIPVISNLVV